MSWLIVSTASPALPQNPDLLVTPRYRVHLPLRRSWGLLPQFVRVFDGPASVPTTLARRKPSRSF